MKNIFLNRGVYLDNAATSYPKPQEVITDMMNYINDNGATSSRGAYRKAIEADKMIYEARKAVAKLFNCPRPSNVVFTLNITEALNLALQGILNPGAHVVTSSIEHNAVWRCLKTLERDKHIKISQVPADCYGNTMPSAVESAIQKNTKLIVFNHASNVIGTIQPIREIGLIAQKYKIPFLADCAQTAGSYCIDMEKDYISLLAFTGHKGLLGPTGTGGLAINWGGDIRPLKQGGTGGDSAFEYQPEYLPNKFEAGTMNVVGIIGLRASIRYLLDTTVEKIRSHETKVIEYAIDRLAQINEVILYGTQDVNKTIGALSFNVGNIPPEEVGFWLDRKYNISVRTGLHCAPGVHELIGTTKRGTVRIGIGYQTSKEEIDYLIEALEVFIGAKECT